MDDNNAPLFRQITSLLEDSIVDGSLKVGERAPSMNELASFHQINPATARKGLSLLIDSGVLEKRRGIGMFVTEQAVHIILERRREKFAATYVVPLVDEAAKLGISRQHALTLFEQVAESRGLYK